MKKEFNVTGSCKPELHYMADIGNKIKKVETLIEKGKYFTINRPRQHGKSTILESLEPRLFASGYSVMFITFESMGDAEFLDEKNFIREFSRQLNKVYKRNGYWELMDYVDSNKGLETFGQMDDFISGLVELTGKPTVLLIDEVDKSSDNQLFLNFLGLLRSKYLSRNKYATFHSVILAGVYDIKTLKLKFRPMEEKKYNSPWNIAADFKVELTFDTSEIGSMLTAYAAENKNKQIMKVVDALSQRLYYYTSGHPFLVSALCKIIEEDILPKKEVKEWSVSDVDESFQRLVSDDYSNTNFDDMYKNLENNKKLYDLVFKIIIDGEKKSFNIGNPVINLGVLLGILSDSEGGVVIHNKVYEQRIYNYMSSKIETSTTMEGFNYRDNFLKDDTSLDFDKVLLKFQEFMKLQYSEKNEAFLEKDGRLVFLAFIKPIINGRGFDFKEVRISEEKRLDVVVTYMGNKYIIELKKWYSEEYHKRGIAQLADYLEKQNQSKGYLLIFDFRKKKKQLKKERILLGDKEIFAVWV